MPCKKTEIIAKESWSYLAIVAVLFIFFSFTDCNFISFVFVIIFLFIAYIFRNPERIPNEFDNLSILAPMDGKILHIGKVFENRYLKKEMLKISIENKIYNVSFQRNPLDLEIQKVIHTKGLNINIKSQKAKLLNEKIDTIALHNNQKILITTFVSSCARNIKIICNNFKKVRKGGRYLIVTNGKIELYLPLNCRIKVTEGYQVKAGESILGYFVNDQQK